MAKRLKGREFSSIVAMPEGDKTFAKLLHESGIPYYQVKNFKRIQPTLNPIAHIKWFLFFIPGVVSLARLVRSSEADIVHACVLPVYLQGPLAAKLSGAKLVWNLDDTHIPKWIKALLIPFFRFLPDKLVVGSEAVNRHYFGNGTLAGETVVLYPPVDTSKFHPADNVEECRRESRLKSGDKVVGIVGNINPAKGYEYFFSAAKLVKQAFPQAKFLVVGKRLRTQEKYWQRLQTLIADLQIEDDIILAGYREDMPGVMNTIDVFVLTSVFEASPIVVMEAMACAKPVVATRVGGVPEIVVDGETGILVPPKEPEAISEAVLYLLNHPEGAKEMGLKGRQRMIEHFDLPICARKHEEIYRMVL